MQCMPSAGLAAVNSVILLLCGFQCSGCSNGAAVIHQPTEVDSSEWKRHLSGVESAQRIEVVMTCELPFEQESYSRIGPFVLDNVSLVTRAQEALYGLQNVEPNRLKSHTMMSPLFAKMTFISDNPPRKTHVYLESDGLVFFPGDEKYMGKLADESLIKQLYKCAREFQSQKGAATPFENAVDGTEPETNVPSATVDGREARP